MTITMWNIVIIAFVVTAAASDLWARKIPRWLTVTGFFAGLLFHAHYGGHQGRGRGGVFRLCHRNHFSFPWARSAAAT